MAALDNIASELLKSANEADLNYKKTRDQAQRDKAVRLRKIVENLRNLSSGTSTLDQVTTAGNTTANTINVGGITSDYYQLDTAATPTPVQGMMFWDSDRSTVDVQLDNDVSAKIGQDNFWYVKNQSGATIPKGKAVMAVGTLGSSGRILIDEMVANGTISSKFLLGITAEDIANGADGFVMNIGKLRQVDTAIWPDGTVLYCDPTTAGNLTSTKPSSPNLALPVAFVVHSAANGVLAIRVSILDENAFNTPTLAQVTTAGNTTTNSITVGGLIVNADATINSLRVGRGAGNIATNTVFGVTALNANISGVRLTAVGYNAGSSNTTGQNNTFLGHSAGLYLISGSDNTIIGQQAGGATITSGTTTFTAYGNTSVGQFSMSYLQDGHSNTAVGTSALNYVRSAFGNSALGWNSLSITTNNGGNYNTAIGYEAGGFGANANTTGANNIFIGYQSTGVSATESNRTWIGNATTTSTWLAGNVLVGTTTNAGYKLDVNGTARVVTSLNVSTAGSGTMNTYLGGSVAIGNDFVNNGYILQIKSINTGIAGIYLRAGGAGGYPILFCQDANGTASTTFIVRETGNVAVGTTTAVAKFTVTGSITAASALAQGVYFNNTLVAAANNDVLVGLDINPTFTNGAFTGVTNLAARINGAVSGITGYYTTGSTATQHYLELVSTSSTNGYVNFRRNGGANGVYAYQLNGGQASFSANASTGETTLFTSSGGGFLNFFSNGSEAMRIPTSRNVLIGTTTDAGYKLDVNGTARISGLLTATNGITVSGGNSNVYGLTFNSGGIGATGQGLFTDGRTNIQQSQGPRTNGGAAYLFTAYLGSNYDTIQLVNNGTTNCILLQGTYGSSNQPQINVNLLHINNTLNFTTGTNLVRGIYYNPTLTSLTGTTHRAIETVTGDVIFGSTSGNVGVGTNSPTTYMTEHRILAISGGPGTQISMVGSRTTNDILGAFAFWNNTNRVADINSIRYNNDTSGAIRFRVADSGSLSEAARIVSNGNVLIGTTTDSGYKLDVAGTGRFTGNLTVSTGGSGTNTFNAGVNYLFANQNNVYGLVDLQNAAGQSVFLKVTGNPTVNASVQFDYFWISGTTTISSGTSTRNVFNIAPGYNATGTYAGIVRGIYYNPTLTSMTGVTHRAIETTSGDVIFNGGNVGIGTTTPTDIFHIVNNTNGNKFARISAGAADASAAWVAQNDQVDNIVYRVFGSGVSGSQMGVALSRSASLIANLGGSGKFLIGTFSATDLVFGTNDQERMRLVNNTGNFLIGTLTDVGTKLNVSGDVNALGYRVNNVVGYTGILNIPGNPPGQQNVDIQGGIIINIF